jgi:hypothetical protein
VAQPSGMVEIVGSIPDLSLQKFERNIMEVKIHSKHIDANLKTAMHAMCGYALSRLGISTRLSNNINLNIHMRHSEHEGESYVHDDANSKRPRDFVIVLDHHQMDRDEYGRKRPDTEWGHKILETLAHELVHVKQYIKRELTGTSGVGLYWKGTKFELEDFIDYYELPYEVEARGKERGLLIGFLVQWNDMQDDINELLKNL